MRFSSLRSLQLHAPSSKPGQAGKGDRFVPRGNDSPDYRTDRGKNHEQEHLP